MGLFHLHKTYILTLALTVCLIGLSTCQSATSITETKPNDSASIATRTKFSDANSISTTVAADEKTESKSSSPSESKGENENATVIAEKGQKVSSPEEKRPKPSGVNSVSNIATAEKTTAQLDEKQDESTDPNAPPSENENEDENDIFEVKLSTLVLVNEAYDRIFTPELVTEDGRVKYSTLKRKRLDVIAAKRELKKLNPAVLMALSRDEHIAFWINTYNFCTIELILRHYPIEPKFYMIIYPDNSIMQISAPWTKEFFDIQREEYTLKEIEQDFLLKRYKDPRICFALPNASIGGATLRNEPYKADRLNAQLDDQVKKYITADKGLRWDKDNNVLYLSNVFQMHTKTFLESEKWAAVKKFRKRKDEERIWLNFIAPHLSEEDIRYLEKNEFKIKFIEFDWHLNEAR